MLGDWLSAPDYSIGRLLLERGLAGTYLVAFVVALRQFPALLGEHGLLPAPQFLRATRFRSAPSLFHLHYSDRALVAVSWAGVIVAGSLVLGLPQAAPLPVTMAAWAALWIGYLSIVNIGQTFYAFGWESLLCEAGFLAVFLGNDATPPPPLVLVGFRWLAFRVEFGAGLIKLRGDRCWRTLRCLDYHHETQPMPNPLSWYFHHLPRRLHSVEVLGNHAAQLLMPIGLFAPQPIAAVAAGTMIATQLYLVVSGNYAWLNWLTIVILFAALPDPVLHAALPIAPAGASAAPTWFELAVVGVTLLVGVLSYWPVRNLLGRRQLMNYAFNALHIVNAYGAFGSVTRSREEVVLEGTGASQPGVGASWLEYGFKAKPGDPRRRPPQIAPYHLRLDWLMWFLPLSPSYGERWFGAFVEGLLRNDPAVVGLLRHNPFPGRPPGAIRARRYRYRYTTWGERRRTGRTWDRVLVGEYLAPVSLLPATSP